MRKFIVLCFLLVVACTAALGVDRAKVDERLRRSAQVVREIMIAPDKGVPKDLLDKAVCGALVCRHGGTGAWAAPSMIIMSGGSFGFQIGGESTDVLFIVMNPDGARKLIQDSVKLGADASVAGGPVGRSSAGATDLQMHAQILSYSRARGLFAGISLSGAMVKQDKEGDKLLYGREISGRDILLRSAVRSPAAASTLDSALTRYSPHGGQPWSE